MHPLAIEIIQKHNPSSCNFIRVRAIELLRAVQKTPEQLEADWDDIYDQLADNNIFVQPALCDVNLDEDIRVFRTNGPLARVILEVLLPTEGGDEFLAQVIAKLNLQTRRNQPRQPRGQARSNGHFERPRNISGRRKQASKPQNGNRPARNETPDPTRADRSSHYIRPLE